MNRQPLVFLLLLGIAACLTGGQTVSAAGPGEIVPVAIWTNGDVFKPDNNPTFYSVEKMIDGDLKTYACLLDTTRQGDNPRTVPPKASYPVTTSFVLDLGKPKTVSGIRFTPPADWRSLCVKNVSVYACDDPQGKTNRRPLAINEELLPTNSSHPVYVLWQPDETRYVAVDVNESWQLRNRRQRMGKETHFNTQIAEICCLSRQPADPVQKNYADRAFPLPRLYNDWMMQDYGLDTSPCFTSSKDFEIEKGMVEKVLKELAAGEKDVANEQRDLARLVSEKVPGNDPQWKNLYLAACEQRRQMRLDYLREETRQIVYVKHFVFGGTEGLTGISHVSDEQHDDATSERRPGSQLCLLTLNDDGTMKHEVLLEKPDGLIRDPNLSFDAKTLVFAMRNDFTTDDYHLYTMNMADRSVRQITFTPEKDGKKYPCADFEPSFTATGNLLFSSTRHVQINDCWPNANTDIYTCDMNGKNIRRLTYDELDVNYPQMLHDGRVLYTRWEYSDRNAYFLHPLCSMNPDGTSQTEYCGNNSMYPSSYIQARPIPDSTKVIAIISGHHVPHKGKLALIDRTLGTQDGKNIEYVAGASPDGTPGRQVSKITTKGYMMREIDFFGQKGPQYQYPFPFDEENYLVAYCPEGWLTQDGPYTPPFGIYYMTATGERELLAFDWWISSGQPVAVMPREIPTVKASQITLDKNVGTFDIQDIYIGPGLKGIPRGTVKKLRVVALEYRAGKMGKGSNAGEVEQGLVQTPVTFNNGAWDVKHVLGEVKVEEDGSVAFEVPARTPVYFQLLDEKGYCVQTMRSWATLQGGERFSCLGCHEDKLETGMMQEGRPTSLAMKKAPQKLRPIGTKEHPLMARLAKESCLDSIENWWGVNAPSMTSDPNAPVDGFSYRQEIQPILDRHCITCHPGVPDKTGKETVAKSHLFPGLDLTGKIRSVSDQKVSWDDDHKRNFTQSYLALTNNGKVKGGKWVQFLEVRSRSEMLPPYHTGSSKSNLMKYLEPSHYNVKVTDVEKRTIACWIDLLIPFCGSYTDANAWTEEEQAEYMYYVVKRRFFAQQDLETVKKLTDKK